LDANLSFFESANIDFEKPIFLNEWGRYCMLMELEAQGDDTCLAKLLLINKQL
jgi:hypothetical protein